MLLEAVVECENTVMRILELSVNQVVREEGSDMKIRKIATFLIIRFLWIWKFRKFEKDVGRFYASEMNFFEWRECCEVEG
jgi:hypothetical protein